MLFIRNGPGILFVRSDEPGKFMKFAQQCGAEQKGFYQAFGGASETDSIVLLYKGEKACDIPGSYHTIYFPEQNTTRLLTRIVNEGKTSIVNKVTQGPSILIMRIPRRGDKIIEEIASEYCGELMDYETAMTVNDKNPTIVMFSDKSIDRLLSFDDIYSRALYLDEGCQEAVFRDLKKNAVRYFNMGLKDRQWSELRINIYDIYEEYDAHLERLYLVLTDLELGLILGEEWTRDQAFVMLSVIAYQVRLFTTSPLEDIKEVLMGLEYDKNGHRLADMDVYYRNRKVDKNSIQGIRDVVMKQGFAPFREKLLEKLSPSAISKLEDIESKLKGKTHPDS